MNDGLRRSQEFRNGEPAAKLRRAEGELTLRKIFLAYFILGSLTGFTLAIGLAFHSVIGSGAILQPWITPLCLLCAAGAGIVSRMSKNAQAKS